MAVAAFGQAQRVFVAKFKTDTRDLQAGGARAGSILKAAVLGVGIAAVGATAGLVAVGREFDTMRDTIITGTGASGKALGGLERAAKNVGKTTPSSFKDIGTAVADVNTRLGLTGKPLEAVSKGFLNLSRITGTDLATNIAEGTRVFGDWGIQANKQAGALDTLFKASQATGISFDQLSRTLVQYGAPLRQLGFSFEQSTALISKFEKEGVNTRLVLGSLRIALGKMAREGEAPIETFRRVTDQIKNTGDAGKANALALELFGARAGPDMAAAIREGRFEIGSLVGQLQNSGGAINDADKRTRDFAESWKVFSNNLKIYVAPIAAAVFNALSAGMEWIATNGIPTIQRLVGHFRSMAGWVRENHTWFVPLIAAVGTFTAVIGAAHVATALFGRTGKVTTGVLKAWAAAQAVVNAVMSANPILLVVGLLAALTAAVIYAWRNSETFRAVVTKVWTSLRTTVAQTVAWLAGAYETVKRNTWDKWVASIQRVGRQASDLRTGVVNAVGRLTAWLYEAYLTVKRNTWDKWVASLKSVQEGAANLRRGMIQTFTRLRDGVGAIFRALIDKIKSPVRAVLSWINDKIIDNVNKVTTKFGLRIPRINTKFHRGGVVPGSGEQMAMVLGGEGVLTPRTTSALGGKSGIEALNKWGAAGGRGGPLDWLTEPIGNLLKKGAAAALRAILAPVVGLVSRIIPGPEFVKTFLTGIVRDWKAKIIAWGSERDKITDQSKAGVSGPGGAIAASGWAKPIGPGYRIGRGSAGHGYLAQDLPAPIGTPVYAMHNGRVIRAADLTYSYGRHLFIAHPGTTGVYAHLSARLAGLNDAVRAGQMIGRVGSTGNSTGPHLHLETRGFDPLAFLRARGIRFDHGGPIPPGITVMDNRTGRTEWLLNRDDIMPRVNVRVFIGDRELTDIVKVEIKNNDDQVSDDLAARGFLP